jgi:polyferredoxin
VLLRTFTETLTIFSSLSLSVFHCSLGTPYRALLAGLPRETPQEVPKETPKSEKEEKKRRKMCEKGRERRLSRSEVNERGNR